MVHTYNDLLLLSETYEGITGRDKLPENSPSNPNPVSPEGENYPVPPDTKPQPEDIKSNISPIAKKLRTAFIKDPSLLYRAEFEGTSVTIELSTGRTVTINLDDFLYVITHFVQTYTLDELR